MENYRYNVSPDSNDEGFIQQKLQDQMVTNSQQFTRIHNINARQRLKQKQQLQSYNKKTILPISCNYKVPKSTIAKPIHIKSDKFAVNQSLNLSKQPKVNEKSILNANWSSNCLIRSSRTSIGDNIRSFNNSNYDSRIIRNYIASSGAKLCYEYQTEINSHAIIKGLTQKKSEFRPNFIDHPLNQYLKKKIDMSFITIKKNKPILAEQSIVFDSLFQSGNLQFAAQNSPLNYELYLKNDTNTHGHQSWFYFRIRNKAYDSQKVVLNICNLKRDLKLIEAGQKIFIRKFQENEWGQWLSSESNLIIKQNLNLKFIQCKVYRLSFELILAEQSSYQVSLLPPYTYSQMLMEIENAQKNGVIVQTLTFSLLGLAIPLLTFKGSGDSKCRQIVLISCRIHPGETVASYVSSGLIRRLIMKDQLVEQLLSVCTIMLIPMINPDGVILGNFRTNFIGVDMNRGFHFNNDILHPQIVSLKTLGQLLKKQYNDKFQIFIDLHGHSIGKNIFTYGPDFNITDKKFYAARLLPKLLDMKCKYFKYNHCTFKLEESKINTARAYFLNTIQCMAYTLQTSYSVYTNEKGKNIFMSMNQWRQFGYEHLCKSIEVVSRLNILNRIKNKQDLKKVLSESQHEQLMLMRKIHREIKKQIKKETNQISTYNFKRLKLEEDSDGEEQTQDLSNVEREQIQKAINHSHYNSMLLPRVNKPNIQYPTVTPKLFRLENTYEDNVKIIYTKRNRYNSVKMTSNNYLKNINAFDLLKPSVRTIRMQKKINNS